MEARMAVVGSIIEALFPPLPDQAEECRRAGDQLSAAFYEWRGMKDPELLLKVVGVMESKLSLSNRRQLFLLLRLLNSRLGTLLLLGVGALVRGVPCAFVDLPRERREAVLLGWSQSPRKQFRMAFKGLKSATMAVLFMFLSPEGTSPLLAAMHYCVADPARPLKPAPPALAAEAAIRAALVDLSAADGLPGGLSAAAAALSSKGVRIMLPDRIKLAAVKGERPHFAVKADAVIIGSGAGGGVAAARLAAAGLKVVVLEKAGFVPASDMTQKEGQSFETMYERGGLLTSEDSTVAVLAGSTLGGGTRINWCASFRTPQHVRREWAEELGLSDFASPKYDASLDAVCHRLSVHTGFAHPPLCATLRDGLQAMGAQSGEVARNCLNPECSGHCCFGCAGGFKQDSVNTWLADACQAGARILTGVYGERILTDTSVSPQPASSGAKAHGRGRRAVGVLCRVGHPAAPLKLVVQAPLVISSCGSIHTPALLLRSGIKCHGNVGANLRLHPATCAVGTFPPRTGTGCQAASPGVAAAAAAGATDVASQQRCIEMSGQAAGAGSIRCWEGTIMSIFSCEVGNWERSGYGALLYTPAVHPGLFSVAAPWLGGASYKELLLDYPNACEILVLTRDRDAGRVTIDSEGQPCINYTLSKGDEASMMEGLELGLRSMAAAGAESVLTLLNSPAGRFSFGERHPAADAGPASVTSGGVAAAHGSNPAFEEYLAQVKQTGAVPLQFAVFSAHQMGTARLGTDPRASVLDPAGECWEVQGLYCCDGSVLPTSTGVNPMLSISSTSHMLGGGIAERAVADLKRRGKWQKRRGGSVPLAYEESGAAAAKL